MNPLEAALFVFILSGGSEPLTCVQRASAVAMCSNGISVDESPDGTLQLSIGLQVRKTADGGLDFSTGLTVRRTSTGWMHFSNGLQVRNAHLPHLQAVGQRVPADLLPHRIRQHRR